MGKAITKKRSQVQKLLAEVAFWKQKFLKVKALSKEKLQGQQEKSSSEKRGFKRAFSGVEKEEEAGHKRRKLSQDPFEVLHPYVHSNIIQHLNVADLKQVSKVSTDWNAIATPELLKKASVHLEVPHDPLEKVEFARLMSRSQRDYRNVKATIEDGDLKSIALLGKFVPAVTTLNITESSDLLTPLVLPSLEKLVIGRISNETAMIILNSNFQLRSLTFAEDGDFCICVIQRLLLAQAELKILRFEDDSMTTFFSRLTADDAFLSPNFPFQLSELKIGSLDEYELHEDKESFVNGMNSLLASQTALKNVEIKSIADPSTINVLFDHHHKSIRSIALEPMVCYSENQQQQLILRRNKRITKAEISSQFPEEDIEELILAMPNLKTLQTYTLTCRMAQFAAANLQRLTKIVCNNMHIDCRETYQKFLIDNPDANQNIKIQILRELEDITN